MYRLRVALLLALCLLSSQALSHGGNGSVPRSYTPAAPVEIKSELTAAKLALKKNK